MTQRQENLSDRYVALFARLVNLKCPECGGIVPRSKLVSRRRSWPQSAACKSCGVRWCLGLSCTELNFRLMTRCGPLVIASVFLMAGFLSAMFPALTHETSTGLKKLRGGSFTFLIIAFFAPVAVFYCRLPLKKETE
ncbi:hypothetical protein [Phaeobacter inhibens]|uniref:hypothetical protein n=1 Tax=Phaeobacter inhibens TaxID=221822 RepID=UPI0021A6320A|nr:hypothetical protein [Phaeobacter inhibens]UWR89543.1 hypothetical protein K4L01_05250 [Phaeobacter inhibens]